MSASPTRGERTLAIVLAGFLGFAGVSHFTNPDFFNEIVPPWLPPNEWFWTWLSGAAEIVVAVLVARASTRRTGAIAAAWLFVAVYPANLYMAWDWRDRPWSEQAISLGRLPFQVLFVWVAIRVARSMDDRPSVPGDVSV